MTGSKRQRFMAQTAYCMKCKSHNEVLNGTEVVWKNGMKALKGTCKSCGTKVNKILGKA